jgi:hypothetical protein
MTYDESNHTEKISTVACPAVRTACRCGALLESLRRMCQTGCLVLDIFETIPAVNRLLDIVAHHALRPVDLDLDVIESLSVTHRNPLYGQHVLEVFKARRLGEWWMGLIGGRSGGAAKRVQLHHRCDFATSITAFRTRDPTSVARLPCGPALLHDATASQCKIKGLG